MVIEISIDTSDVKNKVDILSKRAPKVLDKQLTKYLVGGANKIKTESINIARIEAKGLGHYMQGFGISPIMKFADNEMYIKIYNRMLYSLVIEYGGIWKEMAPPTELKKWVEKALGISGDEALSVAFAIAKTYKKKGDMNTRGQVFYNSKMQKGYVATMRRAKDNSLSYLKTFYNYCIDEGIKAI